jgi:hypothetical protein
MARTKRVPMTTFTGGWATAGDAGQGAEAAPHYEGPHGPVFAGPTQDGLATRVGGPNVPDGQLDYGPNGRLDGQTYTFAIAVPLRIGELTGQAVQPEWALFNRRRRAIRISLGPRSYRYRVTGFSRPLVEREDGTPVASLGGVFGAHRIAEAADPTDVALAMLLFAGVSVGEVRAQA